MASNDSEAKSMGRPQESAPSTSTSHSRSNDRRDDSDRGGRGRGRGQSSRGGRVGRNERNPSKRGGRGGRDQNPKRGEKGRGEWSRNPVDKRKRNDEEQAAKRLKVADGEAAPSLFTADEIATEERKPKRKVAVLIGYAGSGYKGMQINALEKTIEGDLFTAFVAAGAISKANADDPKKSSLVRCARTDKGVHAAGNMISLKLIVEDPNIVQKVNHNLPAQIRVWGIERTNGSFSCYQTCDSRWYEYLIPTYSFVPPHPQSFMGKKLVESAEKEGVYESFRSRQEEVVNFWEEAERTYVQPILDRFNPEMRIEIMEAIHAPDEQDPEHTETVIKPDEKSKAIVDGEETANGTANEDMGIQCNESMDAEVEDIKMADTKAAGTDGKEFEANSTRLDPNATTESSVDQQSVTTSNPALSPLDAAIKEVKAAYLKAKKGYRIPDVRRQRVQDTLSSYVGTQNFHNYTVQKSFRDPSAKRVIRSFKVDTKPIIINDTEWLSLKVHGQSFMMHQIRKMVAMAALVVRCGSDPQIIKDSFGPDNISIPKAPGLGLLLERPVFDSYNERAVKELAREKLDFEKFQKEMDEFKQREIYERIFREEEKEHQFHTFFHHVDHYRSDYFLWVTASGISASKQSLMKEEEAKGKRAELEMDSEDEADAGGGEEG